MGIGVGEPHGSFWPAPAKSESKTQGIISRQGGMTAPYRVYNSPYIEYIVNILIII